MPLVIPNDYGQITVDITNPADPEPFNITFGVSLAGISDYQAVVEGYAAATRTNLKVLTDSAYSWGPVEMRYDDGGVESSVIDYTVEAGTGTASDSLPSNCALLVHKRTALAGRRGRGRIYIPGVFGEEVDDGGHLSTTYKNDVQSAIDAWLGDLVSTSPDLFGMWLLHSTGISATPSPTAVTALIIDPMIATQRTRLRR